ncbi:MAG TPA: VanZ family protein [Candidatus Limnocylindrales bacterium]|nr:VanZ family protein [Candidatus Limnocylindrales bacterium]
MKWLARWWPALVWACLIWTFSTGAFTTQHTSRYIVPFLRWLFPHLEWETLLAIHQIIRKFAHIAEYFVFSLLVLRGLRAGKKERHLGWALVAIAIVAGYAALDEFHQSFVPGRGASVWDVLLDASGGVAAQLVAALVLYWSDVRRQRRATAATVERRVE